VRISIDLSTGVVELLQHDDFTRFDVVLRGVGDLAAIVDGTGLGRVAEDGEHVVVDPRALRVMASPTAAAEDAEDGFATDEAWEKGFAGMCAYAAGKGWVEPDGGILAHIDRAAEAS
jgi:hypothetical protein